MIHDWNSYTNKYGERIYPTSKLGSLKRNEGLLLRCTIKSCVDGAFIYWSKVKRQLKENLNSWNSIGFKSKPYLYRTNWDRPDFDLNLLRHFNKEEYKKLISLIRLYDHRYSSKPNRTLKADHIRMRSLDSFENKLLPRIRKLIEREDQLVEDNNLYKVYLYDKGLLVIIK